MSFKSFYKRVGGNEGSKCHYPARLDTYGCGCQHDCSYCYAKSLLSFRNLWDANHPKVADIEQIRKKIAKLPKDEIVRLGGMTDCFMPLEKTEKVTRETIKALNEAGIGYLIVTKSAMVADDEYMQILDKDLAHIQITVTTLNDELYKKIRYEKASLPSERIRAIEKLQSAGFDVQLRLSPFIPYFVDLDQLARIKCDKILVEFLRINPWIEKWFGKYINSEEYTVKEGGYRHLPLEKKIDLIQKIRGFKELTVCEDESRAYEYWKTVNPDKNDCCNLRKSNGKTKN